MVRNHSLRVEEEDRSGSGAGRCLRPAQATLGAASSPGLPSLAV